MRTFKNFRNFFINLGQLCDKNTCAFVVMGIGKKVVWVGRAEVIRQTVSFCCVSVFVGRRVGWVGIIRHQLLL